MARTSTRLSWHETRRSLAKKRFGDEEEVLRFGAFPRPFRNEAGVDQKGERATRWLRINSLRLIVVACA